MAQEDGQNERRIQDGQPEALPAAVTGAVPSHPTDFDVFLSHNSRDKPTVERLAERLKRAGLEPWLDKWCLTPGGNWQNELLEGIRSSRACAFFIGPHGEGAWAREELHVALDRAAKDRDFRLFLVLLPEVEEPFDATRLPPFLSTRTWVDLRKGVEDARSFQTFVHAVKGVPLGPEVPIEPRDDICPYPGLQTFDESQAEYFFGRDPEVQRLLEKLKTSRFLAVMGSSGSGKSSLVRAGLIPALRKGAMRGSELWPIRLMTPGAHPLESLAAQIVRLDPKASIHRTLDDLAADPRTLHLATTLALSDRPVSERVVWVIDQTEEVFTLCQDQVERTQFLDNLLYAATIPDGRCVVVLTMRADFYPKCAGHPDFCSSVASQQFLVSQMGRDGLRQCIEEPARRVGLEFEQGLVPTMLEEVESQPGALPLLQHALLELWERRRGYMLTLEGHRESGGVQGSIAKRADTVFESLNPERQEIARRTFLRLTQPGEGTEDTRRRATMRELRTSEAEANEVEAVVEELADARLLITSSQENASDAMIDIAHEALIRNWPRLRQWLEEDRASLRVHRRLTEVAIEWERMEREEGFLYRGARLAEAIEWRQQHEAALNDLERQFLDASVALRDREIAERERERVARERLRRRITIGLGIGLLAAVLLAGLALLQWRNAEEQRNTAFGRQIAAQAEVTRTGRSNLLPHSVLLAVEALQRLRAPEAEQTLRRSLALLALPLGRLPHIDFVQGAAFSPDGRLLATASRDRTARLWEASTGKELARLVHDDAVLSVAFSPDSRILASGSSDRSVRLWDTTSGQEIGRLNHNDVVRAVAFSPDGRILAAADQGGAVRLWDPSNRQEIGRLTQGADVQTLAFSGDGRTLIATSGDATQPTSPQNLAFVWDVATTQELARFPHVRPHRPAGLSPDGRLAITSVDDLVATVWSVTSGQPVVRLDHDDDPVLDVAFSPDGRLVATGTAYGTARIWEATTGRPVARLPHDNGVNAVVFSSDGRYLATASTDATVKLWDPMLGVEVARMAHESPAFLAAFSPNARYIASASTDGHAFLWEVASRRELARLPHDGEVNATVFSGDGRLLATASSDGFARLWDTSSGRETARFAHGNDVHAVALTGDGRLLASGGRDGTARLWDAATGQELGRLTHDREVTRVVFSRDGRFLATASADRTARVLDVVSRQEIARLDHDNVVNAVTFSPDGRFLATASDDARIFDLATRQEIARLPHDDGPVMNLAYSPDGSLLATASWRAAARLWNTASNQEQTRLPHSTFLWTVTFSRDGKYFATAATDGTTRVWETATLKELPRRAHDNAFVFNTAFSPDDRYIATASRDRTARLWDVITGEEVARLTHNRDVSRVTFSPDGRLVATGSADRTARIWQSGPEDLIAEACAHLSRNFTRDEWRQYLGDEPYHATCPGLATTP